ncbi:MAG: MGMT family protein [Arthrobacter sp.]|uniref:MGMT family protein n=1 Tax=unclassified Arthrobacter TaxID=235627 RepID=UPI00264BCAC5|nr:MGMT family protein [Micrococcaceae bacterium]MDN5813912.1 MGMT family protein [Micrococcaceae bacterium]MDN5824269.1 MGMT family protein [Micrococcaceae bacterium]MDN5879441.1 MGMT family protein [Micrococcaceae bacterium]MDN5887505.1 MGMT family protein [Micrococcaceae bacterium]
MSAEYARAVHRLACHIPAGAVLTYGDIAELLGAGGPRQVGAAMARSDGALPWWRVLRADGTLPADLQARAIPHWIDESIPLRHGRVRVPVARWQPDEEAFALLDEVAAVLASATVVEEAAPKRRGRML